MTAAEALSMLVMSVLLMLDTCDARSATVRVVSVTLRSMPTPCETSTAAEIERDHERQQHGEFDRRDAALVAAEAGELRH